MDYKSKTANDKEISIYYFSATGNSLKLSQDIAAAFRSRSVQNDTVSWNHRIGLPNRRFYIPHIWADCPALSAGSWKVIRSGKACTISP